MVKLKAGKPVPAFDKPKEVFNIRDVKRIIRSGYQAMCDAMIERDEEIAMVITAMLCKEHSLLVGPPGCGKSHLLDSMVDWITDANKFNIIYTKFTALEEVFGVIDVQKMLDDSMYFRNTAGMLPEAHIAFGDEINTMVSLAA